jgi:hypothetical protein
MNWTQFSDVTHSNRLDLVALVAKQTKGHGFDSHSSQATFQLAQCESFWVTRSPLVCLINTVSLIMFKLFSSHAHLVKNHHLCQLKPFLTLLINPIILQRKFTVVRML